MEELPKANSQQVEEIMSLSNKMAYMPLTNPSP